MKPSSTPLCRVQSADVRYGRVAALSGINLTISAGERIALVGSNGSARAHCCACCTGWSSPSAAM